MSRVSLATMCGWGESAPLNLPFNHNVLVCHIDIGLVSIPTYIVVKPSLAPNRLHASSPTLGGSCLGHTKLICCCWADWA